ncbi:Uncharacterised protein [Klebsiella pneumoniae]|nr:Uncharacterised protein [Klebsiella pneumoniae]
MVGARSLVMLGNADRFSVGKIIKITIACFWSKESRNNRTNGQQTKVNSDWHPGSNTTGIVSVDHPGNDCRTNQWRDPSGNNGRNFPCQCDANITMASTKEFRQKSTLCTKHTPGSNP